jgi:hypothetical protein
MTAAMRPAGHAVALARYFPVAGDETTDALVAETRRHVAGCLLSIETGLRVSLETEPALARLLATAPEPLCWPMLCARPDLISPELLVHMRLRAGVSLILRDPGAAGGDGHDVAPVDAIPDDPAVHEAETLLALAQGRWAAAGGEQMPLRPDLPAEHFADLLWSAVAALAFALQARGFIDGRTVVERCVMAGQAMLDRHDEAAGPMALAARLARIMGARADAPDALGRALGQRQILLFAALAGRRARMTPGTVLSVLLQGAPGLIAKLCAAVGGSGVDLRHLLLLLGVVRPGFSDAMIVAEAERYEALEDEDVAPIMALLRAPDALRSRLALLQAAG